MTARRRISRALLATLAAAAMVVIAVCAPWLYDQLNRESVEQSVQGFTTVATVRRWGEHAGRRHGVARTWNAQGELVGVLLYDEGTLWRGISVQVRHAYEIRDGNPRDVVTVRHVRYVDGRVVEERPIEDGFTREEIDAALRDAPASPEPGGDRESPRTVEPGDGGRGEASAPRVGESAGGPPRCRSGALLPAVTRSDERAPLAAVSSPVSH